MARELPSAGAMQPCGTMVLVSSCHPNYRDQQSLPAELRRTGVPPAVRAWIERAVGKRVDSWRRMPGASTSAIHGVRLSDGAVLVLRRWAWPWVLLDDPAVARRELDALAVAGSGGVPTPEVVAADPTGEQVGDGVPVLLMTRLRGQPLRAPDVRQLALMAARIHDVTASCLAHRYERWCLDELVAPPPNARDPRLWERALFLRATAMPDYRHRFIHRDYNPGNVLWYRGGVSGVVDWSEACRGPWECDIATCRSNLRRLAGPLDADRFVHAYTALTGRSYHPYWDLNYMLENDSEHWTPEVVRQTEPALRQVVHDIETA